MAKFFKNIKDYKIRNQAYLLGAATFLLIILIYIAFSFYGLDKKTLIQQNTIGNLKDISAPLSEKYLLEDTDHAQKAISRIENILLTFEKGGKLNYHDETVEIEKADAALKNILSPLRSNWEKLKQTTLKHIESPNNYSAQVQKDAYSDFYQAADQTEAYIQKMAHEIEDESKLAIGLVVFYALLLLSGFYYVIRYLLMGPLFKISLSTRELAKGNLNEKIEYQSRNELGYIAQNVNTLADMLQNATDFTSKISKGEYEAEYKGLNDTDKNQLANSLLEMREELKKSAKADKDRNWVTEGLAKFADILRNDNDDIKKLSNNLISELVKYMGANQGALFVIHEDDDEERKIKLEAAYAYERKKRINLELSVGEGLVGQSVQEGDTIYLTEVPEDYIQIRSGLGDTPPRCILIVPLKINDEIKGVLEIASISSIPTYKIGFVEKLGENIASTLTTVKTNEKTRKLLVESQEMTEQMRSQEEEMRQNMEEMEATQEEMARAQSEMETKESTLNALINNTTDSIILINTDYEILVMNQVIKDRYKGTQYEGIKEGANALQMLGSVKDEWKAYYDRAFNGEDLHFTLKSSVDGEDTYRQYDINPIKDTNGKITGASIFSRDVTKSKKMELQNEEASKEIRERGYILDGMINNTTDTYFALDKDYNILVVNDVLKKRYQEAGIDLKKGMNILELLSGKDLEKWKSRYDTALKGENFHILEERPTANEVLTIETRCEPIRNTAGEIIGVSTVSRDMTELMRAKKEIEQLKKKLKK